MAADLSKSSRPHIFFENVARYEEYRQEPIVYATEWLWVAVLKCGAELVEMMRVRQQDLAEAGGGIGIERNQLPLMRLIDNQTATGTPPEMAKKRLINSCRLRRVQAKFTTLQRMVSDMHASCVTRYSISPARSKRS